MEKATRFAWLFHCTVLAQPAEVLKDERRVASIKALRLNWGTGARACPQLFAERPFSPSFSLNAPSPPAFR